MAVFSPFLDHCETHFGCKMIISRKQEDKSTFLKGTVNSRKNPLTSLPNPIKDLQNDTNSHFQKWKEMFSKKEIHNLLLCCCSFLNKVLPCTFISLSLKGRPILSRKGPVNAFLKTWINIENLKFGARLRALTTNNYKD